MTIGKDDKKEIGNLIQVAIDKSVTPKLDKIGKKQQEHDGKFKSSDEKLEKIIKKLDATFDAVGDIKVEVTVLQDDLSDQGYTLERIETKLSSTTRRQDDFSIKADQLNRRVLKLEAKKA